MLFFIWVYYPCCFYYTSSKTYHFVSFFYFYFFMCVCGDSFGVYQCSSWTLTLHVFFVVFLEETLRFLWLFFLDRQSVKCELTKSSNRVSCIYLVSCSHFAMPPFILSFFVVSFGLGRFFLLLFCPANSYCFDNFAMATDHNFFQYFFFFFQLMRW